MVNPSTSNDSIETIDSPVEDHEDQTRSQQVIEHIATKLEGGDVHSPGIDWRWWAAMAASLFAASLFAAIIIFGFVLQRQQDKSDAKQDKANAIEECARRYATRVTSADTENDIAQDNLILFLGTPPDQRTPEQEAEVRQELEDAREAMRVARDDRLKYEQELTLPCPIEPLLILPED